MPADSWFDSSRHLMQNEYFDEFLKYNPDWEKVYYERDNFTKFDVRLGEYEARDRCTHKYSFAVTEPGALKLIAQYSPIVELGAGTGYWAFLLRQLGVDIVCFDKAPPYDMASGNSWFNETFIYDMRKGGPEVLKRYRKRTLLMSWPDYNTPFAFESLKAYRGKTFIYIGEGEGGCTGDNNFFKLLDKKWEVKTVYNLPQWSGIHDDLTIYRRK